MQQPQEKTLLHHDPLRMVDFKPDEGDLRNELANTIYRALPLTAVGLGLIYFVLAVAHVFMLPVELMIVLAPLAAASAVLFFMAAGLVKTNAIKPNWAHATAGVFGALGATNSLVHLMLSGDPLQTTNLILVVLAAGALFLSSRWVWLVVGMCVVGFAAVALTAPWQNAWIHFGIALALATFMSAILHRIRKRAYRQMHSLAMADESRKLQLLQTQISLEERVNERTAELAALNSELSDEIDRRKRVEDRLKQNEQHLKRDRNNLEKEVSKRTVELRNANAQLKQAMTLRDAFLANMSHELRTPLNSILGNAEILQENLYGPLNTRQSGAVGRIDSSGRHLLGLINDVLDVSKMGAGKLTLSLAPVNVSALCRSSMAMVRTEAVRKHIALSLILDPAVKMMVVDGRRIKQVIVNLLSNAVKFTPEGGRVGLIVRGRTDMRQVLVMVWDTGIGISDDNLDKLFKPFVQVDSSLSKENQGTGLGLSLSKQLVDLHSGTIHVKSQENKGSLFVVTLPWEPKTNTGWRVQEPPVKRPFDVASPTLIEQKVNTIESMPVDASPSELMEWVSRSPDLQSQLEPLGTAD